MVKRVSTRFLDRDSLSDCYGWEPLFPEDPGYMQSIHQSESGIASSEAIADEEIEQIIAPKRRGRPKRPYIPNHAAPPQPLELGNDGDDGKFAWER